MGAVGGPDVVEVLAVAARFGQHDLVQAGAAAEDQLLAENRVVGDLDDEAREDQVLLDLFLGEPRSDATPRSDVPRRDHKSGSISVFTRRFHRGSARPRRTPPAWSGAGSCAAGSTNVCSASSRAAANVSRRYPARRTDALG